MVMLQEKLTQEHQTLEHTINQYQLPGTQNPPGTLWASLYDVYKPGIPFGDLEIGRKSNWNTTVIKERIGPVSNRYIHHDGGKGREETSIVWKRLRIPDFLRKPLRKDLDIERLPLHNPFKK